MRIKVSVLFNVVNINGVRWRKAAGSVAWAEAAMFLWLASVGSAHAGDNQRDANGNQKNPENKIETVVVAGSVSVDGRREATASKLIVTHEDLTRFGDTTIAESLQRVPGISVARTQGKEIEIRLRGLGSGYTQILIDGSPAPRGFSIESLSPELVERIEVLKAPTADLGSQAIAGSINIVMKKSDRPTTLSAKLGISEFDDRLSSSISVDYADRSGSLSWGVSSTASLINDWWPAVTVNSASTSGGVSLFKRTNTIHEQNRRLSFVTSPSLQYKIEKGSSYGLDGWVQVNDERYSNSDRRTDISGEAPQFVNDLLITNIRSVQSRLTGQLKSDVAGIGRLESKLILSGSRRESDSELTGNDAAETLLLRRAIRSVATEGSGSLVGKFSVALGESHVFDAGWDGQLIERSENRIQRETSPIVGYPTQDLDEDYTAMISRLALFVQDEWKILPNLDAYLGLRWEQLQTHTKGQTLADINVRSSVFSPVAQLLLKVPGTKSDQLRLNLGRTYKAPTARELIPRRWLVADNSPTTPHFEGNPNLHPELAWGLDIGYEHYIDKVAFIGVSAFARRIDDVILPQVYLIDGAWYEIPQNSGRADIEGLEFEAKGKLRELFEEAPDLDLRFDLSRNWSQVKQVPGPGNRLARQPKITGTAGADWRIDHTDWTIGGNYSFEQGGFSRSSITSSAVTPYKRKLDLYALWERDKSCRVRLSVTNALAPTAETRTIYADDEMAIVNIDRTRSFVTVKVQVEMTF